MVRRCPLILEARFDRAFISPNADGVDDIAVFAYRLSRPASISLSLEAQGGRRFYFRRDQARGDGEYSVLFSGVVDGFIHEGESVYGEIERRLMPNGDYKWLLEAEAEDGAVMSLSGRLRVEQGDTPLPIMSEFAISPNTFSPNQDGVADRVSINVYLEKAVERLDVYLVGADGLRIPISARVEERNYGEAGVIASIMKAALTWASIPRRMAATAWSPWRKTASASACAWKANSGLSRAANLSPKSSRKRRASDVAFGVEPYDERWFSDSESLGAPLPLFDDRSALAYSQQITVPLGDMLVFRLTVENYGPVPIRTSGPTPGTVYQQDQLAGALGFFDESGAWRVGVQCETSISSFPYRWAVAGDDRLQTVYDEASENSYRYLAPGRAGGGLGGDPHDRSQGAQSTELLGGLDP